MSDELEEIDQDRIDAMIWKYVGRKPVSVIAKMAGIPPEKVLRRKNDLLEEVDILTIQQKRQKLLIALNEIAEKTQDDYDLAPFEFKAGLMNSAIAAIKATMVELNRSESKDQEAIERLNNQRIQELLRLVDTVVSETLERVSIQHGVDKDEMMDIFQEELVEAAREIE